MWPFWCFSSALINCFDVHLWPWERERELMSCILLWSQALEISIFFHSAIADCWWFLFDLSFILHFCSQCSTGLLLKMNLIFIVLLKPAFPLLSLPHSLVLRLTTFRFYVLCFPLHFDDPICHAVRTVRFSANFWTWFCLRQSWLCCFWSQTRTIIEYIHLKNQKCFMLLLNVHICIA